MRPSRSGRALGIYVGSVAVLGGVGLIAGAASWAPQGVPLWLPALAAAAILGECFPVRLWRAEGEVTVTPGFLLALLWIAGPAPVLLVQAAAALLADLVARKDPARLSFNVGQLSLSWLAAAGVLELLGGGGAALPGRGTEALAPVAALAAAGGVYSVVNITLTAIAPALAHGLRVRDVLLAYGRVEATMMVMLIGFAPVIVVTVQSSPLLLPLLAFPLLAVHMTGQALSRSEHRELHDALTGLPNRRHLLRQLDRLLDGPVAVLVCDLERFDEVSDSLGHVVGEHLLRRVAAILGEQLPARCVIGRLPAGQFVVLAPGHDAARAGALAAELQALLRTVPDVDGMRLDVGLSVGMALAPHHGDDAAQLLKRAQMAAQEARARRGAVRLYRPGADEATADRLRLLGDLRVAIAERAIDCVYQPALDLRTGRVVGVEALARWTHPQRGPVPPSDFIPLAEAGGLIGELGSVVLDRALAQQAAWRDQGVDLRVAVNLSVRRLLDEGVVEEVAGRLAAHGVPPDRLELEITESVFVDDPERARTVLLGLRALGVSLAVDDYGTGYSSLAYLRDLPLDRLKLDRAFVRGLAGNRADEVIVASTVHLARSLGLEVVAEGVEDEATLEAVRRLGCQLAQGYHVGRPQSPQELAAALAGSPMLAA